MKKIVFISSTYANLLEERRQVWDLLEKFEVNVRGMEKFGARTESPLETCLAEVEGADIYIGIIAFRLGSVDNNSGKSYTQLEYEKAYEKNKEILIYLIDEENAKVLAKFIDLDEKRDKLATFKKLLKERHTIATYSSPDDLVEQLERDFRRLLQAKKSENIESLDEFEKAVDAIKKFLLIPNEISGKEVKLKVKMKGEAYPASKEVCDSFNLVFGSTVGVQIQIIEPHSIDTSGINSLYLGAKQIDEIAPIQDREERKIYAKLQFTPAKFERVRARFRPESEYKLPYHLQAIAMALPTLEGETIVHQPDGMTTLLLSRVVDENK